MIIDLTFALVCWVNQPEMRVQDAYKWLFHATQGGEHLLGDPNGPREYLKREWESINASNDEPLFERLTPYGEIIRMNLRPAKAQNLDPNWIFEKFVTSAKSFSANKELLRLEWSMLGALLKSRPLNKINFADWKQLSKEIPDFPAIHHSPEFEALKHPAYRVLREETVNQTPAMTVSNPKY